MAQDTVDAAFTCRAVASKKVPSIESLNSEMPGRELRKDGRRRILRTLLSKLRIKRCASANISEPDPTYKVAYLGNVVTGWAKGKIRLFSVELLCVVMQNRVIYNVFEKMRKNIPFVRYRVVM